MTVCLDPKACSATVDLVERPTSETKLQRVVGDVNPKGIVRYYLTDVGLKATVAQESKSPRVG